ncbi:MAG: hypothetical protein ABIR62_07480 [Dokdonella sp.]|uniref:trypsin-like serine peptidase n=1 Tax=Dokdonella sp. TaxID=2291710 RepID=UPI003263FFFD
MMMKVRAAKRFTLLSAILFACCTTALAMQGDPPYSVAHPQALAGLSVPQLVLKPVDQAGLLASDARQLGASGENAEKRLRVATPNRVDADTDHAGVWVPLADGGRLWRLQLHADGATDLRLGFDRFDVPAGVTLHLIAPSTSAYEGPFTSSDASPDHQLWLAPFAGDTLVLELHVPPGVQLTPHAVHLSSAGTGYRNTTGAGGFTLFGAGASGTCNIDVVCPLGNPYPFEISAVAKFYFDTTEGSFLCTGTLMNDIAQDFKPYFLTADHCINTQAEATSMSLIWNYESPTCGAHGGGSTADTQNGGATLVAHRADVDFSLVRLNSMPSSAFNVAYAGWDANGTATAGSIGIHHPSGWVKAITQNTHTLTTINNCIGTGGGSTATHWKTGPYAQGTTEGGSSGSALLIPSNAPGGGGGRVIGMLSGGGAACSGSVPNTLTDCYGKFSVAFDGSSASQRLSDWLAATSDTIFRNGFEGATAATTAEPASVRSVPSVVRPASDAGK